LQKSVGGVGLRKAQAVPFTREGGRRGRGSSLSPRAGVKASRSGDERTDAENQVVAEASRDRTEIGNVPRRSAVGLRMEDTSDRGLRLIVTEGRIKRSRRPQDVSPLRKRWQQIGEATGVSEVRLDGSARKNHASHESERARRSGSDVVKRRIPRSFEFDGCRPTGQRRGVSLEEKPGAHEARVLVVVAVGSRSQSVGIGIDLHGALQDKPEKGDLARRKSSNPADAGGGGPEMDCDGSSAVTQQR